MPEKLVSNLLPKVLLKKLANQCQVWEEVWEIFMEIWVVGKKKNNQVEVHNKIQEIISKFLNKIKVVQDHLWEIIKLNLI